MGDISLIRTALLVALITAFGLAAAGRAPAAEWEAFVDAISLPQPCRGPAPHRRTVASHFAGPASAGDTRHWPSFRRKAGPSARGPPLLPAVTDDLTHS